MSEASEIDELFAAGGLFDAHTYFQVLTACGFAVRHLEDRTAAVWGNVIAGFDESEWWEGYISTYGDPARNWIHRIRRWDELVTAGHAGHLLIITQRI